MSLNWIKASFECDECGENFWVNLDPASDNFGKQSLFDIAEDGVRAGIEGYGGIIEPCSVQNDKHLCHKCTRIIDEKEINNENLK